MDAVRANEQLTGHAGAIAEAGRHTAADSHRAGDAAADDQCLSRVLS